ncbi:MAG: LPS export ABC transporter periplasmic protein LptC [Gammaproteobacteria bacterium]|jgi:lipopolysaccharide export system protein LptC|nr:LPS export ABC transporter periplasmic protein LptC [Gammaproteobacteria bacterium]MBU2178074.1 LPS export ABC transporter periplasmic protein LptC [Gammaproteobacteria bacterium]MBU2222907.1 LPS export ABC transporter periplasmic protein LptC [Gammaproteobacteria bacterium]MBU2279329.1 LPS export ABC transporter periplasmic protein LptC [Gammaproteobacteria bacterium]MBU2425798.1 LPS export ABC transporter periplasmic protein LptC [Gammaproteobacteria bacterium]
MKKQLFWFLLVITSSSILFSLLIDDDKPQSMAVETELQPDFIAYQLIRTSFDASGSMSGMIRATQMSHFEQLGQIQLEEPAYTIFELQVPKWQVSSSNGVLYPDDKVVLEQNVVLENLKSGELFNKLESEQLEYVFDQQVISTKQQVLISGDGFAISGQGVQVNLVTQKLQLNKHKGTVYRHDK